MGDESHIDIFKHIQELAARYQKKTGKPAPETLLTGDTVVMKKQMQALIKLLEEAGGDASERV